MSRAICTSRQSKRREEDMLQADRIGIVHLDAWTRRAPRGSGSIYCVGKRWRPIQVPWTLQFGKYTDCRARTNSWPKKVVSWVRVTNEPFVAHSSAPLNPCSWFRRGCLSVSNFWLPPTQRCRWQSHRDRVVPFRNTRPLHAPLTIGEFISKAPRERSTPRFSCTARDLRSPFARRFWPEFNSRADGAPCKHFRHTPVQRAHVAEHFTWAETQALVNDAHGAFPLLYGAWMRNIRRVRKIDE